MHRINEKDETVMSICAETHGCFELGTESGEPNGNCVFARLSQSWYASASLDIADGKDSPSIEFPYRLGYPDTDQNQVINKMKPDCLKLAPIAQKCKFKISATSANNGFGEEDENAFNASFSQGEVGNFERLAQAVIPPVHKPNGWLWKRRLAQMQRNL